MNREQRGKIIILAAPSGSGKSTLANRLTGEFDRIRFSVSATTRPPRKGERDGVDYYFLSPDQFREKVEAGEFLEWEEFYGGTRYGTLRPHVEELTAQGYTVLLDIDVLGAASIKKIFGEQALSIFIKPPSLQALRERLQRRGTESGEEIDLRLQRAGEELSLAGRFDCTILNDDLETAYARLREEVIRFTGLAPDG